MDGSQVDDEFIQTPNELDVSDEETDNYKHAKLLQSIGTLDGKKRAVELQRTEPANKASEFHLAPGAGKVDLHDLVGALRNTTGHGVVKKQLGRVQAKQKLLNTPLPQNELDKIQRNLAYETTRAEVSKWDPIISKNRKAEQLQFPLVKPAVQLRTTKQMAKGYKPRTPLEIEVAKLLADSSNVGSMKNELTPAEERALQAMSIEEAKERRAELQKYRALLSYKEAKARRQKKIKSKKFHRVLRKEKEKAEKKELDELQRKDPEAYADMLIKLQKDRIEERMSLKHRGGSKFMKRQALYGKFDEKTRQSTADMLEKSKQLRQKVEVEESSSGGEGSGDSDGEDGPPARYTPAGQPLTAANPWMTATTKKPDRPYARLQAVVNTQKEEDEQEESSEGEEEGDDVKEKRVDEEGEESDGEEDDEVKEKSKLSDLGIDDIFTDAQRKIRKNAEAKQAQKKADALEAREKRRAAKEAHKQKLKENERGKKKKKGESDSDLTDSDSDSEEEQLVSRQTKDRGDDDEGELLIDPTDQGLSGSLKRKQTLEDFEGDWSDGDDSNTRQSASRDTTSAPTAAKQQKTSSSEPQVDPKKYLTVATRLQSSAAPELIEGDGDAEDEQRLTIAQAFAQDDVVEEFRQDKVAAADRDKPKDIDLTLPGWGEWGGAGVVMSKRKKKRFIIKAPKGPPRKDSKLTGVIISEKKDNTISKHQVKRIPFPFTSVNQFEASVRAPVGKTWNPESAYRKLIEPKVVTKMGTVIEPIDKAQVFKKQAGQLPDSKGQDTKSKQMKKGGHQQKKRKAKS